MPRCRARWRSAGPERVGAQPAQGWYAVAQPAPRRPASRARAPRARPQGHAPPCTGGYSRGGARRGVLRTGALALGVPGAQPAAAGTAGQVRSAPHGAAIARDVRGVAPGAVDDHRRCGVLEGEAAEVQARRVVDDAAVLARPAVLVETGRSTQSKTWRKPVHHTTVRRRSTRRRRAPADRRRRRDASLHPVDARARRGRRSGPAAAGPPWREASSSALRPIGFAAGQDVAEGEQHRREDARLTSGDRTGPGSARCRGPTMTVGWVAATS